ncbi:MAG TPA: hypothetical protein VF257_19605 [Solirubrobacteraceae bacterium]
MPAPLLHGENVLNHRNIHRSAAAAPIRWGFRRWRALSWRGVRRRWLVALLGAVVGMLVVAAVASADSDPGWYQGHTAQQQQVIVNWLYENSPQPDDTVPVEGEPAILADDLPQLDDPDFELSRLVADAEAGSELGLWERVTTTLARTVPIIGLAAVDTALWVHDGRLLIKLVAPPSPTARAGQDDDPGVYPVQLYPVDKGTQLWDEPRILAPSDGFAETSNYGATSSLLNNPAYIEGYQDCHWYYNWQGVGGWLDAGDITCALDASDPDRVAVSTRQVWFEPLSEVIKSAHTYDPSTDPPPDANGDAPDPGDWQPHVPAAIDGPDAGPLRSMFDDYFAGLVEVPSCAGLQFAACQSRLHAAGFTHVEHVVLDDWATRTDLGAGETVSVQREGHQRDPHKPIGVATNPSPKPTPVPVPPTMSSESSNPCDLSPGGTHADPDPGHVHSFFDLYDDGYPISPPRGTPSTFLLWGATWLNGTNWTGFGYSHIVAKHGWTPLDAQQTRATLADPEHSYNKTTRERDRYIGGIRPGQFSWTLLPSGQPEICVRAVVVEPRNISDFERPSDGVTDYQPAEQDQTGIWTSFGAVAGYGVQ